MHRVLLVDDEPVIRMAFQSVVNWEETEFEITGTVSNGIEALSFLKNHEIDLVITDLKMPQMDGLTLIRYLHDMHFQGSILVLSNYSDFNLVREALLSGAQDYMLKVKMNSKNILSTLRHLMSNQTLKLEKDMSPFPLRQNQTRDNRLETLSILLREQGLANDLTTAQKKVLLPCSTYQMYNIYLDRKENGKIVTEKSFRSIVQMVFSDQQNIELLRFSRHEYLCLVPSGNSSIGNDTIYNRAIQLTRHFRVYLNQGCTVITGGEIGSVDILCSKYKACQACFELAFYEDFPTVCDVEDFLPSRLNANYSAENGASFLTECYWNNGAEAVYQKMDHFLEDCSKKHVAPKDVREFAYHIIHVLLFANPLPSDHQLFRKHVEVLHCTRKTTLIQLLMELLPSIIEMPSEMQFHHCRKEIRAVLSYLQYHYTENLTLDDIATMANLDRSYLCRLFKKEMGMSIFQYINEIRMKKAAELITNENTYIREVALAVGIEDQYYFARLFKKHFGVSPTEYRETTE